MVSDDGYPFDKLIFNMCSLFAGAAELACDDENDHEDVSTEQDEDRQVQE